MALDFSGVRWINNGEPFDATVLNRPLQDVVDILIDEFDGRYTNEQIDALVADESLINAIIFGS